MCAVAPARTLAFMVTGVPASRASSVVAPAPPIDVRGLSRRYGAVDVVRDVDLTVAAGEVFALLGPNGAGKTTVAEILEGFRDRSGGTVSVLGADPAAPPAGWRERIGIVLQESAPDPGLTVQEAVELYAGYHARPLSPVETLERVGLAGRASTSTAAISGGERRRLDLAIALVGDPELLFLDEPTTGFDPAARRAAWDLIDGLRDGGTSIFLTTHFMDEAERLADRIAVIVAGHVVAVGPPATLAGRDRAPAEIGFSLDDAAPSLPETLRSRVTAHVGSRLTLSSPTPLPDLAALAAWSRSSGVVVADLTVSRPSLEDVYLALTGAPKGSR
jgi:ABC-2 type transport system ATP-binding protein